MVSTRIMGQLATISVADTSVEKHTHMYDIDRYEISKSHCYAIRATWSDLCFSKLT